MLLIVCSLHAVQVHGPCTEESTEAPYPTPNSITVISTRVTAYQRVKTQVKTHPVLCTVWSVCSIFGICLIVGCIAIAVLVDPCSSYSAVNIVYSFDILLVDPNIDASCHTELLLQEVASKMNAREQDLQIFAGKCGDIPEYRDTIYHPQYGYTNFTGSFGIYGSTYFTVNSNVTVAINASTPHEKSSKVIVCLFDNQTSFFEFSTNQEKWKEYIQYAMLCNSTVVSTSKPTVETVFTFNFETQGYYSLGIASYELISYLDEVVSGERFLYNTTNLTRVNCSLHTYSAPACRLPLSSIDSNPCLLVRAVPPVDDETGFSGLQITSDSDSTPQHSGWTIGLLALAGIIFLCLVVLLVVVLKKIVCR